MKEYDNKAFGRTVKRVRKERKVSQEVLSTAVGITRSHLSNIETGKVRTCIETVWKIAVSLDIEPSELLRLTAEEIENEENA